MDCLQKQQAYGIPKTTYALVNSVCLPEQRQCFLKDIYAGMKFQLATL
jgi:hypothetical protein